MVKLIWSRKCIQKQRNSSWTKVFRAMLGNFLPFWNRRNCWRWCPTKSFQQLVLWSQRPACYWWHFRSASGDCPSSRCCWWALYNFRSFDSAGWGLQLWTHQRLFSYCATADVVIFSSLCFVVTNKKKPVGVVPLATAERLVDNVRLLAKKLKKRSGREAISMTVAALSLFDYRLSGCTPIAGARGFTLGRLRLA